MEANACIRRGQLGALLLRKGLYSAIARWQGQANKKGTSEHYSQAKRRRR